MQKLKQYLAALVIMAIAAATSVWAATTFSWSDIAGSGTLTYTDLGITNPKYSVGLSLDTAASVTLTADGTEATGVYGQHHYNDDADVITYVLPAVAKGMMVTIGNSDLGATNVITIEIDDSDKIVLDGTLLDAGDTIDSPAAAGASITLIGLDSVRWITINRTGAWVDGGAT